MAKGKMTKGKMGKGEMAKIGGEMAKGEVGKGEMGINQNHIVHEACRLGRKLQHWLPVYYQILRVANIWH
jgi:hypothetical protein